MKNQLLVILTSSLGIFFACSGPVQKDQTMETAMEVAPSSSSEVSQKVLDHHLESFGQNDLEAVVSDYTEESIIITPDSTYKGLEQISSFFTGLFPSFPTDSTEISMKSIFVENEVAYIVWDCTTPTLEVPFGTDTFIIEDGKIRIQTFAAVINPVE
jgi:hypothetical protein